MEISLTFDDGPDPVETPRVLQALDRARAPATFFVIASLALRHPRLIQEIREAGHDVQFHCTRHVRHTGLTPKEVEQDAHTGLKELNTIGITPRLWRTPWGATAPWTFEVASRYGLEIAPWTIDTHDWRGDPAASMLRAAVPLLQPGAVVLMHDELGPGSRRADCRETAALIEPLVERIRALGCEPAPMKPVREVAPA